jgi:hypothetical protein
MWDAMQSCPAEDYNEAYQSAITAENKLRGKLEKQDKLDKAAPELLRALEQIDATCDDLHIAIDEGTTWKEVSNAITHIQQLAQTSISASR